MPRKTGKAPYLGKNKLNWCPNDNIPILQKKECPNCGQKTIEIKLTPPGDVRPAFSKDLRLIRSTIDENFGIGIGNLLIPKNDIVLLNKIGGLDYNAEIILNGFIYGLFFFDPIRQKYFFKPKRIGSQKIVDLARKSGIKLKKFIEISDESTSFILDGKSVLAPGVIDFDSTIQKGDYCLILNKNQYVTTGIALIESEEIKKLIQKKHGNIAKNVKKSIRSPLKLEISPSKENLNKIIEKKIDDGTQNDWRFVYNVNSEHISSIVEDAKEFIKKTKLIQNKRTAVAYSGGKDSLCTLLLAYEALGPNFDIFFADTGLEFPEILENTQKVVKLLNMEEKLIIRTAGDKFWELIDDFGPPARDYRFCCHTLKSQQILNIIESISSGGKVLSFLGQRRYESYSRAAEKKIYINSFIPTQIAATPIKEWNALEVWLYLLYHPHKINGKVVEFPITSIYLQGFSRLGCYLCPATSLSSFNLMREIHPELLSKWDNWLKIYAEKFNYPPEWVKFGLWRFKKLNSIWRQTLKKIGISYDLSVLDHHSPLKIMITKGFSPCILSGGFSLKGKFNIALDLSLILHQQTIIEGNYELLEDLGVLSIISKQFKINIFSDGSFYIRVPSTTSKIEKLVQKLVGIISKSQRCNGCGVCEKLCPNALITVNKDGNTFFPSIHKNSSNMCSGCAICISHCPVYQKLKDYISEIGLKI